MTTGIYKIANKLDHKCYVGSSVNIEKRWKGHIQGKGNQHLYNSICKYGVDNFDFEVIQLCPRSDLLYWEQIYIDKLQPEYNKSDNATCPSDLSHLWGNQHAKGLVHTAEAKQKISEGLKGKKFTPEHKAKISAANKGQHSGHKYEKGHPVSEEWKAENSKRMKRWWKFWKKEGIR